MAESISMKELYETCERMSKIKAGLNELHHTLTSVNQNIEYLLKKVNDTGSNGGSEDRAEGSGNARARSEVYTPPHLRNTGNQQGNTSITYKMEFPEFNGENPQNWVRDANRFFQLNQNEGINKFFQLNQGKNINKVLHAGYYMIDVADTWYTEYVEGQPGIDWETFCEMLLQRFIAPGGKDISAGVSNEENIEMLNVSGVDVAEPAKDGSLIKPSQLPIVHSSRGTSLKNNVAKVSTLEKLHILKPKRAKNGTTPFVKNNILNPTNGSSEGVTALSNPVPERKHVLTVLKKRPTPQALSRNDFFNQICKKSMNSFSASDLSISNSSSGPGKITEMEPVVYDDEPAEEILQILDKEEFDFLFMSRQLYAAEFRDADKIIDSSSVSCDAFERLREHWYVTTFSKDLFHVELSEHQHFIDRRIEFLESQDARRSSREFLYEILEKVIKAGTTTLNIHDTIGFNLPSEFGGLIAAIKSNALRIENATISTHYQNDLGLAIANTLMRALAGARQEEVTVNRIGERAGNASLKEVVIAIKCSGKQALDALYTGIDTQYIVRASKMVEEYSGLRVQPHKASVGANASAHENGDAVTDSELLEAVSSSSADVIRFLNVMAICNTVIPVQSKSRAITYKAQSQDEEALVCAAAHLQMVFENKSGSRIQYEVLDILEVTSDRKRMSVVVKDLTIAVARFIQKGGLFVNGAFERQQHEKQLATLRSIANIAGETRPEKPIVIERSEGSYVYDTNGRKYLDSLAGLWCTALGGSEPCLVNPATKQLNTLSFYHSFWNRTTKPSLDLAKELLEMFTQTKLAKAFFTNSESEANDMQVKLVWYYNNALGRLDKNKLFARSKAYHGSTLISACLSGLPALHHKFDLPAPFILHTDCPHYWRYHLPGESEEQFSTRMANNLELVTSCFRIWDPGGRNSGARISRRPIVLAYHNLEDKVVFKREALSRFHFSRFYFYLNVLQLTLVTL